MFKTEKFQTMSFNLNKENEDVALHIISTRQKEIMDLNTKLSEAEKKLALENPDLASEITALKKKLKKKKELFKWTLEGLQNKPYSVWADVRVERSSSPGYLYFIENTGSEIVLLEKEGELIEQTKMDID